MLNIKKILKLTCGFIFLMSNLSFAESIKKNILIYNGPGTDLNSTQTTFSFFKRIVKDLEDKFLNPRVIYQVQYLSPKKLLDTNWEKNAALIVMPGGADIPYTKVLNGKGNEKIKNFVENGGRYLGICAGAYYASSKVEFAVGIPEMEVLETRELGFYPQSVKGPILAPYDYKSYQGARAATIEWAVKKQFAPYKKEFTAYYNGGGYFVNPSQVSDLQVLAYYTGEFKNHAAIIERRIGKGKALLSGVHFEYDSKSFKSSKDPHLKKIISQMKKHEKDTKKLGLFLIQRLLYN